MAHAPRIFFTALVLASVLSPAQAVEVLRNDFQGASGMCKAATADYAAGVRYRPLGLSNESGAVIFVTCNWQGDDSTGSIRGARKVSAIVSNDGPAATEVVCTLVDGFQSGIQVFASYTPITRIIEPGVGSSFDWLPSDISGAPATIELPSLSCMLPAGTTLQYTVKQYAEDVGA